MLKKYYFNLFYLNSLKNTFCIENFTISIKLLIPNNKKVINSIKKHKVINQLLVHPSQEKLEIFNRKYDFFLIISFKGFLALELRLTHFCILMIALKFKFINKRFKYN